MTNTKEINRLFASFYSELYKSEADPEVDDYETFFSKINLSETVASLG